MEVMLIEYYSCISVAIRTSCDGRLCSLHFTDTSSNSVQWCVNDLPVVFFSFYLGQVPNLIWPKPQPAQTVFHLSNYQNVSVNDLFLNIQE